MDVPLVSVRRALRVVTRAPGFVLVSALVIGLGIATMTTVFSIANTLFFRPLPQVRAPHEVMDVAAVTGDGATFSVFSHPTYLRLQSVRGVFNGLAAYGTVTMGLARDGFARQVWGVAISPNYFQVLGVRAELGRLLGAGEADPRAVVLSHRLWTREFGADRTIPGRRIQLNGQLFTVIGVAPPGFTGTMRGFGPELWIPISKDMGTGGEGRSLDDPSSAWLQVVGRLQSGTRLSVAAEKLTQAAVGGDSDPGLPQVRALTLRTAGQLNGTARTGIVGLSTILMLAAGGLLLTAVTNVSGMLLARSSVRSREIAIRLAVGATRPEIFRQFATEGLLLGASGMLAGILISGVLLHWLNRIRPPVDLPLSLDLRLDPVVLGFSCVVGVIVALVFVIIPTREAWRTDVMSVLRNGGQTAARRDTRLRVRFVTIQAVSTVTLLAVAGTFANAVRKGLGVELGLRPENVVVAGLGMDSRGLAADAGHSAQEQILARIRAQPGVTAAALTSSLPLGPAVTHAGVSNAAAEAGARNLPVGLSWVSDGYFRALGITMRRGREFDPADRAGSQLVAIVNETLAKRLWGREDAVGQSLRFDGKSYEVVGVARDGKYGSVAETPQPFVYLSIGQEYVSAITLVAKVERAPGAALSALPRLIQEVEPGIPVTNVMSFRSAIAVSLLPQRLTAFLTAVLGFVGLVLAGVGLYGTISYTVGTRTREIGIRMALGETGRSVLLSVMKDSLRIVGKGVVMGLVLAGIAMSLVERLAFGIGAGELLVLALSGGVMLASAAAASYVPALRATRVDPLLALRAEC